MAALKNIDPSIRTLALTNYSTFLKAAAPLGSHKHAAEMLRVVPSVESEWCTDSMERACQFLAAYGLEVIRKGASIPSDQTRAMLTLAGAHMERLLIEQQAQESQPGAFDDRPE